MSIKNTFMFALCVIVSLGLCGCGKAPNAGAPPTAAADTHEHGEWWCNEHGVPEAVCAQCSTKLAADFKAKGDWCKEHDRPDSQCFVCHPELEAKFAAQYEAKYDKKPPKPEGG